MSSALRSSMLLAVCAAACAQAGVLRGDGVLEAREALDAAYAKDLGELASWAAEHGLVEQAQTAQSWLPKREPGKLYLFVLPEPGAKQAAANQPDAVVEWNTRFRELREAQADALFGLARQALKEHRPSLAYELVLETARENPDHKQARRLLGYVKYHDAWHTPYEVKQLSAGKVWHERFGWLPKAHVKRYENGQRFYQNRWISAEEEARLRTDMQHGWRIETDHYSITTNHSLEEGVRLARRLERLYGFWQHIFVRYLASEAELARWFDGTSQRTRETRQHRVVYYRSRDEYNAALQPSQPQIGITLGIYFGNTQTANFFAGDDQDQGTLFHEATHQLFQETRPVAKEIGRHENFWIVEAIACYMESLHEGAEYYTLGGQDAGRVPAARERLLNDHFSVPLAELVRFGMDDLQHDKRIAKLYSQSSGLADFLMHYDGGRYREALVAYLEAVYSGKANQQTLRDLAGVGYEQLDRQYREFLAAGDTSESAAAKTAEALGRE